MKELGVASIGVGEVLDGSASAETLNCPSKCVLGDIALAELREHLGEYPPGIADIVDVPSAAIEQVERLKRRTARLIE